MESSRSHLTFLPLLLLCLLPNLIFSVGSLDHRVHRNHLARTTKSSATPERRIQMRAGAPFKIALFADLHYGEAASTDWGPLQDVNSTTVMNTVLDDETPDHHLNRTIRLPATPERQLQMQAGVPLRIALFADLHFGEDAWTQWGPLQDVNSIKVMNKVLDDETPDFVIYLGDVITANNMMIQNASLYWDQAISPTRNKGIPWASVFGNHDDAYFEWPLEWFSAPGIPQIHCPPTTSSSSGEEQCSFKGTGRLELMQNEIKHNALSFSRNGPRDLWPSVSNYVLQVSSHDDPQSPVAFLYFLDSGGGSYPEIISSCQAEWFRLKAQEINPDSRVPEIIFWHIPSKAYNNVAPKFGIHKPCVGSINKEKVAAQEDESGIMEILVKRTSVKAIFVGHNHGLDWCCPYKKLWLCYARHTGYGGYGNWPRGARIVEFSHNPFSLRSWIRMEDGHTHSELVLN